MKKPIGIQIERVDENTEALADFVGTPDNSTLITVNFPKPFTEKLLAFVMVVILLTEKSMQCIH